MSATRASYRRAVLLAAVSLVCAVALLLPAPVLAAEGDGPDHVLTYTTGNLTWDEQTEVRADGTAHMSLFSEAHQNVASSNGERVFAPGTEASNVTRLENRSDNPIRYIAVMYRAKDEPSLPIEPELSGSGCEETEDYPLPDGVQESQVVRAVTGTVEAGDVQDLGISWAWQYHESDSRDATDTMLGDRAAYFEADDAEVGLYFVVVDDSVAEKGAYVYPSLPQTGEGAVAVVAALLTMSGFLLVIVALAGGRRARKCEGL